MSIRSIAIIGVMITVGFCTQGYADLPENFESYADTAAMQAVWQVLPITQPAVSTSLSTSEFYTGAKSLRYYYNCGVSPYYSQIIQVFPSDQNWTDYNVLNFWLKGESSATNSGEYLCIYLYKLNGTVYNDPNDLELIGSTSLSSVMQTAAWQEIQANIQAGFGDRSAVRAIGIGVEPHYYGDGYLWFDDLSLDSATMEPLDNFESYADTAALLDFGTNDGNGGGWSGGVSVPTTAVLSLSTTEVYEGLQAMRYDYNNSVAPNYSKAMKWLPWSSGNGLDLRPYDFLTLRFKCTDASGYLFMYLVDGYGNNQARIDYNGHEMLPEGDWTKWEIDLSTIPNDDKWMVGRLDLYMNDDTATGCLWNSGTVYFDDIHLNLCVLDIPGDVDGNCRVNYQDLVKFASYWLDNTCVAETWCDSCDIDKSGEVDLLDFAVLANHYGECNLLIQGDCD